MRTTEKRVEMLGNSGFAELSTGFRETLRCEKDHEEVNSVEFSPQKTHQNAPGKR